jgi:hypothetical protein
MKPIIKKSHFISYCPAILNCNISNKNIKRILPEETTWSIFGIPVYTCERKVSFHPNDDAYAESSVLVIMGK